MSQELKVGVVFNGVIYAHSLLYTLEDGDDGEQAVFEPLEDDTQLPSVPRAVLERTGNLEPLNAKPKTRTVATPKTEVAPPQSFANKSWRVTSDNPHGKTSSAWWKHELRANGVEFADDAKLADLKAIYDEHSQKSG
jgi:hypothetical protein